MRSERLAIAAALALAVCTHGNAMLSGFAFDDVHYLTRNQAVQSLDLRRLVSEPYWSGAGSSAPYWRPVAMLSFAAQHAVAGLEPWSYHLVSIGLHACAVGLAFVLALRFCRSWAAAFAGAALLAVHPVCVEAVSSVGHRPDLLAAVFGLAALLVHTRAQSAWRTAGATGALLLACASKETGVCVLAPMLAHDLATGSLKGRRWAWVAYTVVAAGYLAARQAVLGGFVPSEIWFAANPLAAQPFWTQKLLALSVLGRALLLVLWPDRLTVDHGYHAVNLDPIAAFPLASLGLLAILGLGWAALSNARRAPAVTVGLVLAAATWLPASQLLFPVEVTLGERLLYLPLTGLAMAAAGALAGAPPHLLVPSATVLALVLGTRTVVRTFDWRDNETLYAAAVRAEPRSARAWFAYAQAVRRRGDLAGALERYDRALAIWPGFTWALCERAELLRLSGRPEEALTSARLAFALDPGERRLFRCLVAELRAASRWDELRALEAEAARAFPGGR